MTQAQQSEAQRLAAICETKGMFPVADELNRMHARILELEQGKCLHQIAEPEALTELDATLLNQAVGMLEALSNDLRSHGNDSAAEGAACSAGAVQRLAAALLSTERAAAPQAVQPAVPVLFVSREQLQSHTDHLASEAGRYLPARKTAVGKFTMPLYAHPAEGVPAQAAQFVAGITANIDKLNGLHQERPWNLIQAEVLSEAIAALASIRELAATQPAAQGLDAPNEWEGIHTMPTCDDLIWLYCQDTNTIDGPIAPDPSLEQYGWTHWAYANAPSTAGIDAAQAKQGGV